MQTTELTSLDQERDYLQQVINYKAKILILENEKQEWQREKEELLLKQIIVSPSQNKEVSTDELVKPMSQINLKYGEIKILKEENQKIKQEAAQGMEKSNQS